MVHRAAAAKGTTKAKQPRRKPEPVEVTQVHPVALATAKELAKGDLTRLVFLSSTEVLIKNR
jgi:hypothetical protein